MKREFVPFLLLGVVVITAILLFVLLSKRGNRYIHPVPEGAQVGDLLLEDCEYKVKRTGTRYAARCGSLIVPENHALSDGRLLSLPVKVILSPNSEKLEPVFYFAGGPGASNMSFNPGDDLLAEHDVVTVGYRGVDGSTVLQCSAVQSVFRSSRHAVNSEAFLMELGAAAAECQAEFSAAGVDWEQYRIDTVIEDFELARRALGYEQINVLAESYGTRVVQVYAAMYPDSIRRSIQIGVNPSGHFYWDQHVTQSILEGYNPLCAATEACSRRTENLTGSMLKASQNVPERWFLFPIDMEAIRSLAFVFLFNRVTAPSVIDAYLSAEQGDYSGFAMMTLMYRIAFPDVFVFGDLFAKGGSADYMPGRDYRSEFQRDPDTILGNPISLMIWGGMQDNWHSYRMPEALRQVQPSSVETLLVNGTLDISTPLQAGQEEYLPSLQNGHLVVLNDQGHVNDVWLVNQEATRHLITTFYRTGEVDDSLYADAEWTLKMGMSYGTMMKLVAFLPPTLLLALGFLLVNRMKRKRNRRRK